MELSRRLFELRRKSGLSQEELAGLVGVSRQAVQKWEAGTSRPDLENLVALADCLQVSLDYLVAGKEPSVTPQSTTIVHHHYDRWHYEYKSKRTLLGLPLVHINYGHGLRRAKGIIAIGNIATGWVALGGVTLGFFSLGGLSFGLLLALGGVALGAVAVGGVAAGLATLGAVALGLLAWGGVACGMYCAGGVALASRVAVGSVACAPLAIGAVADGAQTFTLPLNAGQLDAVRDAIFSACRGATQWLARFLFFCAQYGL